MNDEWTFKKNQSSSLWDKNNQCKPAFYSVVDVGNNYNMLDSIIASTDTLIESNYTPDSWSVYSTTLSDVQITMDKNYSATVSVVDALVEANDLLIDAIKGLERIIVGINDHEIISPKNYNLSQNYPNPFNPTTQINYSVPKNSYITLKVYNSLGVEIATLFDGVQHIGNYVTFFDGTNLASGVYLYQLMANDFIQTKKLLLLK